MISLTQLLSLVLLPPTFAVGHGFIAHKEKGCNTQMDIRSNGVPVKNNTLIIDRAITDWDHGAGRTYANMSYPSATATGDYSKDAGTFFVYWKVDQPDPGCQFILMEGSIFGWKALSQLPGYEMLRVSQEGCYYTSVRPDMPLITSYCCGYDDCAIAEVEVQRPPPKETTGDELPDCAVRGYATEATIQNGRQIAITKPQTCEADPSCTHSISQSYSIGVAVSSSQSYTWTTDRGYDVGFDAGVDFIEDFTIRGSLSTRISEAWAHEVGYSVTETNVTTTDEGGRQEAGTVAFYSFTPRYECHKVDFVCGKDIYGYDKYLEGIDICEPQEPNPGWGANGMFRMVYISE
ncbi:hypothetical protein F5Y05DRAFT_423000 [Hypoxylon sp. FL0543]|nr:hypothetical protein F5Y05DRAFT_423000 [Hypoxylon sp. FL0543]